MRALGIVKRKPRRDAAVGLRTETADVETYIREIEVKVNKGQLLPNQVLEANRQKAIGKHLSSRGRRVRAIELILDAIGAEKEFVPMNAPRAVENGLPSDVDVQEP